MNIEELNTQLEYLGETKGLIKQAIINKGQDIGENDTFRSFVQKINDIETGIETANIPVWYTSGSTGATEIFENAVANKIQLGSIIQPTHWTRLDTNSTIRTEPLVDDFVVMYGGFNEGEYIYLSQIVEIAEHTAEEQIYACKITPIFGTLKTTLAEKLNITSNVLKAGTTILDVSGKSTIIDTEEDNNAATSGDVVYGKIAYVNGQKITGSLQPVDSTHPAQNIDPINVTGHTMMMSDIFILQATCDTSGVGALILKDNDPIYIAVKEPVLAGLISLTAGKIKSGETILGITGTYSDAMKSYNSETAMNNDIANIQEGEVVKVVASGTTTHYIKETTMKKLVKEEDTI